MSYSKIRKISTSKLDYLFEKGDWTLEAPSSSSYSSSNSINRNLRSLVGDFPAMNSLETIRPPTISFPPQMSSLLTSSSASLSTSAQTDDEYGYYDDFCTDGEFLPRSYDEGGLLEAVHPSLSRKCSSKSTNNSSFTTSATRFSSSKLATTPTSVSRTRDLMQLPQSNFVKRSSSNVVCLIEEHQVDLSCRSFESGIETNKEKVTVCLAIAGKRICRYQFVEFAEYQVQVTIDGQEFIVWKSYEDFRSLGEACRCYMEEQLQQQQHPTSRRSSSSGRKACSLMKTVTAWNEVVAHRPWFSKPTTLPFIHEESKLLEEFMRELLFEIPSIDMLVAFLVD